MSPMWQWLATGGIATIISLVISAPKFRGEGRQAEGAGRKSLTDAQIAEQEATLKATREEADRATSARVDAETARDACRTEKRQMRHDFEAFVDVIEELVPLLPPGESQRKARVAIRAARLSI